MDIRGIDRHQLGIDPELRMDPLAKETCAICKGEFICLGFGICKYCYRDFPQDPKVLETVIKVGETNAFCLPHREDCRFIMHWFCQEQESVFYRLEIEEMPADSLHSRNPDFNNWVIQAPRCVQGTEVAQAINSIFHTDLVSGLYVEALLGLSKVRCAPYNISKVHMWKHDRNMESFYSLSQIINFISIKEEEKWVTKMNKLLKQMRVALKSKEPLEALKSLQSELTQDGTLPT